MCELWGQEECPPTLVTPTSPNLTGNEKNNKPAIDKEDRREAQQIKALYTIIAWGGLKQSMVRTTGDKNMRVTIVMTCPRTTPTMFLGAGEPSSQSRDIFNVSRASCFPVGGESHREGVVAPQQNRRPWDRR